MSELYFVPTPNWFISKPLDIYLSDDVTNPNNGLVAFGVIGTIYFTDHKFEAFHGCIKDAHLKRLNSLAFNRQSNESCLLASCGEDLDLKLWNAQTKRLVASHQLHQSVPTCLDWFVNDIPSDMLIISGDNKGNIFKWNARTNDHVRYFPDNKPITQIKTCENQYLAAVGYSHGTIVVLNCAADQMKILFKFKQHESAINCLCWYPTRTQLVSDQYKFDQIDDNNFLLCSSAEDKTIRLWSIQNGTQVFMTHAPGTVSDVVNSQTGKNTNKINYTPLLWPKQRYILSASYCGDLFALDLSESTELPYESLKWKIFKGNRFGKKVIYNIGFFQNTIITLSLDKSITLWNIDSLQQNKCLSTLNGYVYSIISSPVDSNTYAIGVGDSSIKIFNEKHNTKCFKSLSNNIKTEITQVNGFEVELTYSSNLFIYLIYVSYSI